MSRIDELRAELAQLEGLRRRADKLRGKRGRLEVSHETLDELETAIGREVPASERADGTFWIDIQSLRILIDQKLTA